jgi:hypothetical protein
MLREYLHNHRCIKIHPNLDNFAFLKPTHPTKFLEHIHPLLSLCLGSMFHNCPIPTDHDTFDFALDESSYTSHHRIQRIVDDFSFGTVRPAMAFYTTGGSPDDIVSDIILEKGWRIAVFERLERSLDSLDSKHFCDTKWGGYSARGVEAGLFNRDRNCRIKQCDWNNKEKIPV